MICNVRLYITRVLYMRVLCMRVLYVLSYFAAAVFGCVPRRLDPVTARSRMRTVAVSDRRARLHAHIRAFIRQEGRIKWISMDEGLNSAFLHRTPRQC
jgi:hypothetical protein